MALIRTPEQERLEIKTLKEVSAFASNPDQTMLAMGIESMVPSHALPTNFATAEATVTFVRKHPEQALELIIEEIKHAN